MEIEKFDQILKIYKSSLLLVGVGTPKNPKIARYYKYYPKIIKISCILNMCSLFYTFIIAFINVDKLIIFGMGIIILVASISLILGYKFLVNIDKYNDCLEKCKNVCAEMLSLTNLNVKKEFQKFLCESKVELKIQRIFAKASTVAIAIVQPMIMSVYFHKFMIPVPILIPFFDPHNFFCWIVLYLNQFVMTIFLVNLNNIIFVTMYIIIKHFLTVIIAMKDIIKQLKENMNEFNSNVKTYVQIHCNLIEHQNIFINLTSFQIFLFETLAYTLFLLAWITIFFDQTALPVCVGGLLATMPYFILTRMNEIVSDAYDDLRNSIYDLKWYEMTPKDRKTVLMFLVMDQQKLLKVGPLHILSFEYLSIFFNRVYNYGLYLNFCISN